MRYFYKKQTGSFLREFCKNSSLKTGPKLLREPEVLGRALRTTTGGVSKVDFVPAKSIER